MNIVGVNAVFHDSAAALVVDGMTVAAAGEERFGPFAVRRARVAGSEAVASAQVAA